MTRVCIDLNVRTHGNQTFTRLKNVHGPVRVGQAVEVYEEESEIYGPATVTKIDKRKGLVYLAVEWAKLREAVMELDDVLAFVANAAASRVSGGSAASSVARLLAPDRNKTYGGSDRGDSPIFSNVRLLSPA